MYENATYTNTVHARGALMWAFLVQFLVFTSTFTHMVSDASYKVRIDPKFGLRADYRCHPNSRNSR